MNGVLLIDKPSGLTSHDVVSWARRRLGQRDIGHAGTLDPMATGLLVLVVGKATRLSSLLTGKDKTYEAEVRLGFATDSDDAEGDPLEQPSGDVPPDSVIRQALESFIGSHPQLPPSHSAKKVAGQRAYALARRDQPVALRPVDVSLRSVESVNVEGDRIRFRLTVSAGFYVRALARDLGRKLGCGGHLSALRRTASGSFEVLRALSIAEASDPGCDISAHLVTPAQALPDVPSVSLTEAGMKRVRHGNPIGPEDVRAVEGELAGLHTVKIVTDDGQLVALAEWRMGSLHPIVVLG
jgi:tRNA pseudouridine55 synthase